MAPRSTRQIRTHFLSLISDAAAAGGLDERLEVVEAIRAGSREDSKALDRMLLGTLLEQRQAIQRAGSIQEELRALVEKVSAPPWHPGRLLRLIETPGGRRALVHCGGGARLVEIGDGVAPESLAPGAPVFLNEERNLLVGDAPGDLLRCGETAHYDRRMADGRLVLRWRDEELIVDAASALDVDALAGGDQVHWDRAAWMAFERVERRGADEYLVEEALDVGPESVGGQDECLRELLNALCARTLAPELAGAYGVRGRCSVVLHGPPGCGKTLMARVAASELGRLSGRRCRFFAVKPGEWESPWVGETQANIRRCFAALHGAAADGLAVLFLDEVEAIGQHRGGAVSQHADKFTAACLAELDGFADRGDVAIVSATNRKDLLDPALLDRLSDLQIAVGRPDAHAAGRIFEIHLRESVPVDPGGPAAASTRREMIESAVSWLYAPNADNAVCVLHFRDGSRRPVAAAELASGRLIEQTCRSARLAAFVRQLEGGTAGVRVADMEKAVAGAVEGLATTLTPRSAHRYLGDLPEDVDVVRVERSQRRLRRPARYLSAA